MKEQRPENGGVMLPVEHSGTLLFDKEGSAIGVALTDGSLDYASRSEEVVLVIRPVPKTPKKAER